VAHHTPPDQVSLSRTAAGLNRFSAECIEAFKVAPFRSNVQNTIPIRILFPARLFGFLKTPIINVMGSIRETANPLCPKERFSL
jgi:hypothetical protein